MVSNLATAADEPKLKSEIRALFNDAHTILNEDSSITQTDRDAIHQAIWDDTQTKLQARVNQLGAGGLRR